MTTTNTQQVASDSGVVEVDSDKPMLPTSCTLLIQHVMACMILEWQTQQAMETVERVRQNVIEGKEDEEQEEMARGDDEGIEWDDGLVRKAAMEGESILQELLDSAARHHVIHRNELSIECFNAARRSNKEQFCKRIPINTPLTECCFSRRTQNCKRVQFVYREPSHPHRTTSRVFTVYPEWHHFLQAVSWVGSFPSWIKQHVRGKRVSGEWKRRTDVYNALNNKDDMLTCEQFVSLQQAMALITDMLNKHSEPPTPNNLRT